MGSVSSGPIVLKPIVGPEFKTIEEARRRLRERVMKGDFRMDGYEGRILRVLNPEENFT
jgi:hypothetical protein